VREVEQRGHRLFRGTIEERLYDLRQSRSPGTRAPHGRREDVAGAFPIVTQMPLLLQDPQVRAHRRVTRRIGQLGQHIGRGRPPKAIHDLHDLTLTAGQLVV
jgi:hypothetical protein